MYAYCICLYDWDLPPFADVSFVVVTDFLHKLLNGQIDGTVWTTGNKFCPNCLKSESNKFVFFFGKISFFFTNYFNFI